MQPIMSLALGPLHQNCRVSIWNIFNFRPVRMKSNAIIDICFKIFAMALYKVVSQLLALVRWRAQAHLCVTPGMMRVLNLKDPESVWGCSQWLWVCLVTRRRTPGGMSVTISLSGLVLNLTTTGMWPTWVVRLRLMSPVRWQWWGLERWSTWRGARNPRHSAVQVPWYGLRYHENHDIRGLWYHNILISATISQALSHDMYLWYHNILISQPKSTDIYMISLAISYKNSARNGFYNCILWYHTWYHRKIRYHIWYHTWYHSFWQYHSSARNG